MTDTDQQALDFFPRWLRTLGDDVVAVAGTLTDGSLAPEVRLWSAAAVGYLFKSLDLVPDGIQDLGFLDDAMVLRVAAKNATEEPGYSESRGNLVLEGLAADAELVEAFLADQAPRLSRYVSELRVALSRGRSPSDVVEDSALAVQMVEDARSWSASYDPPPFAGDKRTLTKLRAFLLTKLP